MGKFASARRRVGALVVLTIAAALVQVPAAQAAPANDSFANAMALTVPSTTTLDGSGSTLEPTEPPPSSAWGQSASVWFRVDGAPGSAVLVSTAGSAFDTAVATWTGTSLGSLKQISCSYSASSSDHGRVRNAIPASGTLYVQVVNEGGDTPGMTKVTVAQLAAPTNDNITNAKAVTSFPLVEEVPMDSASAEVGDFGPCYLNTQSTTVWYRIDPTEEAHVQAAAGGAYYVNVYKGSPGSLEAVTCEYNRASFEVNPGTTYWVQVADYGNGGLVSVDIKEFVAPANDDFDDAAPIRINQTLKGTFEGASIEEGEPACGPTYDDTASVWYKFTVPVNQLLRVRSNAYYLGVYTETPAGLTELACSADVPIAGQVATQVAGLPVLALGGRTYYVRAADYGFYFGYPTSFDISLRTALGEL